MKSSSRLGLAGILMATTFLCVTPVKVCANDITLADLMEEGARIVSGDKVFFNFHTLVQVGELQVPANEIFVSPIIGGPGLQDTEYGIRFSSAMWTLTGEDQHYDFSVDFSVRQINGLRLITDNTLEITGGYVGSGRAEIAEGVVDPAGLTLANKLVFFDQFGARLLDHQEFTGGPYDVVLISKDFTMSTGEGADSRVFVSHFDQTFSQVAVPEATSSLLLLGLGMLGCAVFRWRRQ